MDKEYIAPEETAMCEGFWIDDDGHWQEPEDSHYGCESDYQIWLALLNEE